MLSINLALSSRGIKALQYAEVFDKYFESRLIPMYGRTIHTKDGKKIFQPYSNKKEHFINSISRSDINKILLNAAEKTNRIKLNFNTKCDKVDLDNNRIHFGKNIIDVQSPIIGADGYKSVVSNAISKKQLIHAYGPFKKVVIMDIKKTMKE